jgi:hypothetical protein
LLNSNSIYSIFAEGLVGALCVAVDSLSQL